MKKFAFYIFSIFFCLSLSAQTLSAQSPFTGRWEGALSVGGNQIRLVFNINKQKNELEASLDSPDQGVRGLKIDSVGQNGDSLFLHIAVAGASYAGRLTNNGQKLEGEWRQGGQNLPLQMQRVEEEELPARPQLPEGPIPYISEEVSFPNEKAGVTLSGTFTRPKGDGQFPAIVLVSGSGPQDRDETIMDHKPFLILADYFSRHGLAVLRYDDRGFGQSTGNFAAATTEDFAEDAAAALNYLQYRPDVKANQIGVLGHSEGGIIAPMLAQTKSPLAFLVLLAPPILPGHELILLQGELIQQKQGASEQALENYRRVQQSILEIARSEADNQKAGQQLKSLLKATYDSLPAETKPSNLSSIINGQVAQLLSPWFRYYVSYDPAPLFADLQKPTLALFGSKDVQVPATENARALQRIKQTENKDNIRIEIIEGVNHLFQPAVSGLPGEYNQIETTVAPEVPARINNWIWDQLPSAAPK